MITYWDSAPESDPFYQAVKFSARMNTFAALASGASTFLLSIPLSTGVMRSEGMIQRRRRRGANAQRALWPERATVWHTQARPLPDAVLSLTVQNSQRPRLEKLRGQRKHAALPLVKHRIPQGVNGMYQIIFKRSGADIGTVHWNGAFHETLSLARTIVCKCEADVFRTVEVANGAEVCAELAPFGDIATA